LSNVHTNAFEAFLGRGEVEPLFELPAVAQAMLDFEAALAAAEAEVGLIPAEAAARIAGCCRAELLDLDALMRDSRRAGSLAIPLVKQLTAAVAAFDPAAAQVVHWGSTSQDAIDSAMVLVTRRALALIDRDLGRLIGALLALHARYGDAPMAGRTLLQPASVIAFGFKVTNWLAPLLRCRARLHAAGSAALQLQFGGAVGTLATLGDAGPAIARALAERLQLPAPQGAWHTQRDAWVSLGCELGVLTGAVGKIALDFALMAQFELGEVAEPAGAGRGGSSAMPHKRNPVSCMAARAAALRAPGHVAALLAGMAQEHERALGGWQAELAEWPALIACTHAAVGAMGEACAGLQVFPERMAANIEALHGLLRAEAASMRLAQVLGKPRAAALLETLSQRTLAERRPLRDLLVEAVAASDELRPAVSAAEIEALFDPRQAASAARLRADEALLHLRPQAAALDAAAPWRAFLPPET